MGLDLFDLRIPVVYLRIDNVLHRFQNYQNLFEGFRFRLTHVLWYKVKHMTDENVYLVWLDFQEWRDHKINIIIND